MKIKDDRDARHQQIRAIQEHRKANRQKRFQHSRLDRFRADIEDFASHGYSLNDITEWLAKHRKTVIHRSTVARRLIKWQKEIG